MTRRRIAYALAGLAAVLVAMTSVVSLWVAAQIWDGAFPIAYEAPRYDLNVVGYDSDAGTVLLEARGNPDLRNAGVLGLEWEGGYGRLGPIVEQSGDLVERQLELLTGDGPGASARIDGSAFPGDPLVAHGLVFDNIEYPAEDGPLPAWLVHGDRATWVIAVHGRSGDRREALRLLPAFAAHELPALLITYRNGRETTLAPGAIYGYGTTEWADLEGAVRYALDAGADDVVLVGYSMGGAIAVSFLYRSDLASEVRAVILDAPALDLAAAGDMQLRDGGVPGFLTGPMRWVAGVRYGIDWSETDYLREVDRLDVPILLLHGDADRTVPVETSRELARLRPDIVTYVELPGVGHVRGWNEAQEVYLEAIDAFLDRVLAAPAAASAAR